MKGKLQSNSKLIENRTEFANAPRPTTSVYLVVWLYEACTRQLKPMAELQHSTTTLRRQLAYAKVHGSCRGQTQSRCMLNASFLAPEPPILPETMRYATLVKSLLARLPRKLPVSISSPSKGVPSSPDRDPCSQTPNASTDYRLHSPYQHHHTCILHPPY
jgi:hypothetical protein